ncbi:hypothetical protein [Polaribacter gochangensis]|uniref:hypothetical protein n=1 Tax=Polaribacter gochangensis TaxID=3252903 RepID=UPI00390490E3
MKLFDRIQDSKRNIKESQKFNVTSEVLKFIDKIKDRKNDKIFLMSIPTSLVASNESYFKDIFSNLIDYDKKFLDNSKKLMQRNKVDIDDIFHISKLSFSIGDLVAYSLKYSSIETILNTFKEISEIDVFKEINGLREILLDYGVEEWILNRRELNIGSILKNLKELYEMRNMICHDFLSATHKLEIDSELIIDYILDTVLLQYSVDILCSEKIYEKLIPNEYKERKNHFESIINEKEEYLNKLYNELKNSFTSKQQIQNLVENIKIFQKYLENDCENVHSFWLDKFDDEFLFIDTSVRHKINLLDQRIKNIEQQIYSS